MIYREMREYGTSLICLDQHISKISDTVKGNSACHIAFQQQLPQDIYDISELMNLKDKKEFFSNLPVGTAIVKLSERFNSPFLAEVPFAELRTQPVSDEELSKRMESFFIQKDIVEHPETQFNQALLGNLVLEKPVIVQNPIEKNDWTGLTEEQQEIYNIIKSRLLNRERLIDIERYLEKSGRHDSLDIIRAINYVFEEQLKTPKEKVYCEIPKDSHLELPQTDVTTEEESFLNFLKQNLNHAKSTVEIYRTLGFSGRKGNQIKNKLLKKNLIKIEEMRNNTGWKKFIRLV
jgi:hypothetical protein